MMSKPWPLVPIEATYLGLYDGPHATPEPSEEGPTFLGIKNITEDGHLDFSEVRHISENDFPTWTRRVLPQPGDIVFTYEATLNRYAMIPQGFRGCLGRRLALIRPDPGKVVAKYLFYYFFGDEWQRTIAKNMILGSTVDRIPLVSFPQFKVRLPPLPIQRQIVSILSAYDELIENNTRRITLLEKMARALYEEWFVKFRFPGHKGVKMVESELGMVPEGWEIIKLEDVAGVNLLSVRSGHEPEEIYYIDIASVSTGRVNNTDFLAFRDAPSRARRIVKHGDTIWSTVRPNLKLYSLILRPLENLIVSTGFAVISAQAIPYTYLYLAVTTDDFATYLTNHATGAAYPAVNTRDFQQATLLLPSPDVLEKFHNIVESDLLQKQILLDRNAILRRTRDKLLPKLISGEIDVSSWVEGEGIEEAVAVAARGRGPGMARETRPVARIDAGKLERPELWG